MLRKIEYSNTVDNHFELHNLAGCYATLFGWTDAAIKAMSTSNQKESELHSLPNVYADSGEPAKDEYERELRRAYLKAARAGEWAIYKQLQHYSFCALWSLREFSKREPKFKNNRQRKLFMRNFVATFNWWRTSVVVLSTLKHRRGEMFCSGRNGDNPLPHKKLLYLGPKGCRDKAVLEDYYLYAIAWLKALPPYPSGSNSDDGKFDVYLDLLNTVCKGYRRATIVHTSHKYGALNWLEEVLKEAGWSCEEKTHHHGDYSGEHYEIKMPFMHFEFVAAVDEAT